LVLNDFVASALSTGEITLLSDGSPWRPLIHVADMARAMEWGLTRDSGGEFVAVNAGSEAWNYQIKDLAAAVARNLGGIPVRVNADAAPDKRSYRVNFAKFKTMAPKHQPKWNLDNAVAELVKGLRPVIAQGFDFRKSSFVRLHVLSELMKAHRLDSSLHWLKA
jgi:nucleoside-diphosphate-sugar epimerase